MGDMAEHPKSLDVKRTAQSKYTMILPKVPADYLLLFNGITAYIECKSSQDELGFPISNIKEHQLQSSLEIEAAGAPFYFFVCKREPRNNVMYIVTGREMREMIRVLKEAKLIKSKIPWATVAAHAVHTLPKSRGCVYDLHSLLITRHFHR
jgi:penicillin-binding protein-related factor A (putative recombinase)